MILCEARPPLPADFFGCLAVCNDSHTFDKTDEQINLRQFWAEMFILNRAQARLVEARIGATKTIVGFGFSVFVTSEFLRIAVSREESGLGSFLVRSSERRNDFLLTYEEIELGNCSGDLNLFVLHYGWDRTLADELQHDIGVKMFDSLRSVHDGYGVKWFGKEAWSGAERDDLMKFLNCQQMAAFHSKSGSSYLMGLDGPHLSHNSALQPYSTLFRQQKALLNLSARQREILHLGSEGCSDTRIAKILRVKLSTVQDYWKDIYAKFQERPNKRKRHDDSLTLELFSSSDPKFKKAARQVLYQYVKSNPWEVRPSICSVAPEWEDWTDNSKSDNAASPDIAR